jgi:hypothetical protein
MRQRQQSKHDEAAAAAAGDRMGKQHADAQANDTHRHLLQPKYYSSTSEALLSSQTAYTRARRQT